MEKYVTWVGYAAVAYFLVRYVIYRGSVALLATRHAFACLKVYKESRLKLFMGVFMSALMDSHSYICLGKKTIWWRGLRNGVRWESIREYADKRGWCKQVAEQHASGHNFFALHDLAEFSQYEDSFGMVGQSEKLRVYVDLCDRKLSALPAAGPVVYVEAYGTFEWINDPDRDFIRFLAEHFQRVVIIRNHGTSDQQPFSYMYCEEVEVNGEKFIAFGLDSFYDDYLPDICDE